MTVFIDVNYHASSPSKQVISQACTQSNGNAQPSVECHENKHKYVADGHLQNMQEGLYYMRAACHRLSA